MYNTYTSERTFIDATEEIVYRRDRSNLREYAANVRAQRIRDFKQLPYFGINEKESNLSLRRIASSEDWGFVNLEYQLPDDPAECASVSVGMWNMRIGDGYPKTRDDYPEKYLVSLEDAYIYVQDDEGLSLVEFVKGDTAIRVQVSNHPELDPRELAQKLVPAVELNIQ